MLDAASPASEVTLPRGVRPTRLGDTTITGGREGGRKSGMLTFPAGRSGGGRVGGPDRVTDCAVGRESPAASNQAGSRDAGTSGAPAASPAPAQPGPASPPASAAAGQAGGSSAAAQSSPQAAIPGNPPPERISPPPEAAAATSAPPDTTTAPPKRAHTAPPKRFETRAKTSDKPSPLSTPLRETPRRAATLVEDATATRHHHQQPRRRDRHPGRPADAECRTPCTLDAPRAAHAIASYCPDTRWSTAKSDLGASPAGDAGHRAARRKAGR